MTNRTIHADLFLAMALYTPTHRVIYFPAHAMHLVHWAVTHRAVNAGSDVRLVREEDVSRFIDPINSGPGGLFGPCGYRSQLLDLGTVRLHRFVTLHALRDVGDGGVPGLVGVLVTVFAFELRGRVRVTLVWIRLL